MTAEKEDIVNVVPCRESETAIEKKAVEVSRFIPWARK